MGAFHAPLGADDDLLEFVNLHVCAGPELPEEVTHIDWSSSEGIEVSVQVPVDAPAIFPAYLPTFQNGEGAGMDWLL